MYYQNILTTENINKFNNYTFGIEIEYELLVKCKSDYFIEKFNEENSSNWLSKTEGTINKASVLNGRNYGGEISSDILSFNKKSFDQILKVCDFLKENGALITNKCAGHIHIGSQALEGNEKYLFNLLMLYYKFNDVINVFFQNNQEFESRFNNKYSMNMDFIFEKILRDFYVKNLSFFDLIDYYLVKNNFPSYLEVSFFRCTEENFVNGNTIEFKKPNGTLNETIWTQNILFLLNLFYRSTKEDLDITKVLSNNYETIEKKVDSFVDMVFENLFEKEMFIKRFYSQNNSLVRERKIIL